LPEPFDELLARCNRNALKLELRDQCMTGDSGYVAVGSCCHQAAGVSGDDEAVVGGFDVVRDVLLNCETEGGVFDHPLEIADQHVDH